MLKGCDKKCLIIGTQFLREKTYRLNLYLKEI